MTVTKMFIETVGFLVVAMILFIAASMIPVVSGLCIAAGAVAVVGGFGSYITFAKEALHS